MRALTYKFSKFALQQNGLTADSQSVTPFAIACWICYWRSYHQQYSRFLPAHSFAAVYWQWPKDVLLHLLPILQFSYCFGTIGVFPIWLFKQTTRVIKP